MPVAAVVTRQALPVLRLHRRAPFLGEADEGRLVGGVSCVIRAGAVAGLAASRLQLVGRVLPERPGVQCFAEVLVLLAVALDAAHLADVRRGRCGRRFLRCRVLGRRHRGGHAQQPVQEIDHDVAPIGTACARSRLVRRLLGHGGQLGFRRAWLLGRQSLAAPRVGDTHGTRESGSGGRIYFREIARRCQRRVATEGR